MLGPKRLAGADGCPVLLNLTDGMKRNLAGDLLHTHNFIIASYTPPCFCPTDFEQIVLLSLTFFMVTIN